MNHTAKMTYSCDGDVTTAETRLVDGVAYYKSSFDSYWYVDVGDDYLLILSQLASNYSELEYSDGVYKTDSFVYDDDGYEYEIINLSVSFDSNGRLLTLHYKEAEDDGNGIYDFSFSNYSKTALPPEDDIVIDNGAVPDGPNMSDGAPNTGEDHTDSNAGADHTDSNAGADDSGVQDVTPSLTEEEWKAAFDLNGCNFTANVSAHSPGGSLDYEYRIIGNEVYYTLIHDVCWEQTDFASFEQNYSPFADTYSDFKFNGSDYSCSESSLDFGESASVIDVFVLFDEEGRLLRLSYTLKMNDEYGNMVIDFRNYDETVAPDLSEGNGSALDNGDSGMMSDCDGSDVSVADKVAD